MEQITLNLIPGGIPQICNVSQYDDGRVIRLHLKNGSSDYTLSETETISLSVSKSDRTTYVCAVTNTSSSYVDITTVQEMCDVSGESECKLTISSGNTVLGTGNFRMIVDPDAFDGDLKVKSVSGPIATFKTNLAEDLIKLDVDLEPIQDLHGYDNPWPAGGGANKITVNRTKGNAGEYGPNVTRDWDYTKYYVGISYNNYYNEGSIDSYDVGNDVVSLTTSRNAYGIAFPIKAEPNKQYCVGCTTNGTIKFATSYFDSNGSLIRYNYNFSTRQVITTPNGCATIVLVVYDGSASGTQISASNIFINDPATVTEWTPYSNICPISGHDSAKLFRTGKNLIDNDDFFNFQSWKPNLVTVGEYPTNYSNRGYKLPTKVGETHTISFGIDENDIPRYVYLCKTDGITSTRVAYITTGSALLNRTFTFTSDGSLYYLRSGSMIDQSAFEEQIGKIDFVQLELGSTATDYEPYTSEPTPVTVQFGQTVYGGTLDSASRRLRVDTRYMVFDGTQEILRANWRPLNNSVGWLYRPNITPILKIMW